MPSRILQDSPDSEIWHMCTWQLLIYLTFRKSAFTELHTYVARTVAVICPHTTYLMLNRGRDWMSRFWLTSLSWKSGLESHRPYPYLDSVKGAWKLSTQSEGSMTLSVLCYTSFALWYWFSSSVTLDVLISSTESIDMNTHFDCFNFRGITEDKWDRTQAIIWGDQTKFRKGVAE